jgi:hypothetical protein
VEHVFVDAEDLRVHLVQAGQGKPAMMLHGRPQHWYRWRRMIPLLAPRERTCVIPAATSHDPPPIKGGVSDGTPVASAPDEQRNASPCPRLAAARARRGGTSDMHRVR